MMVGNIKTRIVSLYDPDPTSGEYKKLKRYAFKNLFPKFDRTDFLTESKESSLIEMAKEGNEEAKKQLISANMVLIVSFSQMHLGMGVSPDELLESSIAGFLKGVEEYDESKGFRFPIWTHNYMYESIIRTLKEKGTEEVKLFYEKKVRRTDIVDLIDNYLKWKPLPPKIQEAINLLPELEKTLVCATNGIGMDKMSKKDIFFKLKIGTMKQSSMMRSILYEIKDIIGWE